MSWASSAPLLLSNVTTISPKAGVSFDSAESTAMTVVASFAPGATVTKPPWLIELDQALYFAEPATTFCPPLETRSKLAAWLGKRGVADLERKGPAARPS